MPKKPKAGREKDGGKEGAERENGLETVGPLQYMTRNLSYTKFSDNIRRGIYFSADWFQLLSDLQHWLHTFVDKIKGCYKYKMLRVEEIPSMQT